MNDNIPAGYNDEGQIDVPGIRVPVSVMEWLAEQEEN